MRRGWELDTGSDDGEQIGTEALALADALWEATMAGDTERVLAITRTIAEVEGKPQERVEHSGTVKRVSIQLEDTPEDPGDVEELL